ncbi:MULTISPECIES: DUF6298 domain-containing protein [Chitinophagaceae]
MKRIFFYITIAVLSASVKAQKSKKVKPVLPISVENGRLVYTADSLTGDRIPDYSYCGYKASETPIPFVAVKAKVPIVKGDATGYIQTAIDYVAQLPVDNNGFRGAVLLEKGTYEIDGQLVVNTSGIVIRGSGADGQTILFGKGANRDALIRIVGKNDQVLRNKVDVAQQYVPVNAKSFIVANAAELKVGDQIEIKRPSTQKWIDVLGTQTFGGGVSALGWKPGDVDIAFERTIKVIDGNTITVDVPLTNALDKQYGGGTVEVSTWPGRIQNIGIENLSLVSDFDKRNLKDEDHRWMAITLENVEDAWVRQMSFSHFAGSAVHILETAKRITVEDCLSLDPVSEIGGQRRYSFFTRGQQTLFQRCYAAGGYHDFAVGYAAAGPNAFVQCSADRPYSFSGTIDRWASGVLFDVVSVDGNAIRFGNREQDGRGAGWTAANCFLWNCTSARIDCYQPPTAQNWALGSWSQFAGNGYWGESNNTLSPRSFYYAQLEARLGRKDVSQAFMMETPTDASSSPSVEAAQALTAEAVKPKLQLNTWIKQAAVHNKISLEVANGAKTISVNNYTKQNAATPKMVMRNQDGWLVGIDGAVLTGSVQEVPWWTGGVEGNELELAKKKLAITRNVPGRIGPGLTDDLSDVVASMKSDNIAGLNQHYGLWYERRRDDHERIRRMDGDVWVPFYELPFKRSGIDSAWDGLSKYDLTQYNQWYWNRMKQFVELALPQNKILLHQNYFQHNIIEAGAHYADFPWRTANNINNTGFNEPVNFAGDKRIFYGEQFYDIHQPVRKKLHQLYIQKCLENFRDNSNVIQFTGEEFTGPLHFVQFWLETIKDWETKNVKELIGLSTTKDVQDAILANPQYAAIVDVIDIKYWHYQADGKVYAPEGGKNLAPRQWARLLKPKASSFEQVYRAVKEYRLKYPNKIVIYSGDGADKNGWAVLMGGGSLANLPLGTNTDFLRAASHMKPLDTSENNFLLAGANGLIVYANQQSAVSLDLRSFSGKYLVKYINTTSGKLVDAAQTVSAGTIIKLDVPKGASILWLQKI